MEITAKVVGGAVAYDVGHDFPLTQDTTGALRVAGSFTGSGDATAANQVSANTKLDTLHTDLLAATPAGTNIIGKVGIDQTTAGTTNAVVPGAAATANGISTTARLASAAASTNAANVKASAGRIYSIQGYNAAGYPVYLVLYDTATTPTPGTTTIRKKIPLPAGAAFALDWMVGLSFTTGIGYALTKLAADADTTALAAGDVLQLNVDYV